MAWHSKMTSDAVEEVMAALSTLHHHEFFTRFSEELKENMLNAATGVSDTDLVPLVRRYQAQQDLTGELSQMTKNAMSHVAYLQGDEQ